MYGTGDRVSHSDITVFRPIAESQRFPGPQGHGSEDAPVAGQRVPTALRNTSAFLRTIAGPACAQHIDVAPASEVVRYRRFGAGRLRRLLVLRQIHSGRTNHDVV